MSTSRPFASPSCASQLGPRFRLKETWDRYNIPIAITEVHHGCTRDEQVRWLHQVWTEAEAARREGVDLRAVTLWAIFGMMDWRSLLTRREGAYDVGCFRHALGSSASDPACEGGIAAWSGRNDRSSRARPAGLVEAAGPHAMRGRGTTCSTLRDASRSAYPDHRRDWHPGQGLRANLRAPRPCARPDQPRRLDITDDNRSRRRSSGTSRGRSSTPLASCGPGRRMRSSTNAFQSTPPGRSCWPGLQAARHPAGHLLVRPGLRRQARPGLCRA